MLINYIQQKNPNFQEIEKILQPAIQSNIWSNNGQIKQELENHLHKLLNLPKEKCVVCTNSGTSSLQLLIMYYEYTCNRKLKWASSSYTFPSAVINNLDNVKLFDIDLDTFTIPLDSIIEDYDGFIITNLFGTYPPNIQDWINYCRENGKILIFDNASSPLSTFDGKNICELGDSCIGSLHCTKYLGGASEGGFIVIDKDKYDIINSLTNFGFNNSRKYNKYSSNYKMSEINAAVHLYHLKNYDVEKHIYNQGTLIEEIDQLEGVKVFNYNTGVILGNLPLLFDKIIDNRDFTDLGIMAHKYYLPLNENHKNSNELYKHILNLPLHAGLTNFQIEFIIKQIKRKANE